jgi:hypothetical protein
MFNLDLQLFGGLFGGGGGGTQVVEKPVVNNTAPASISSSIQQESATDTEKAERRKKWGADVRGRRSTITGAGTSAGALNAAGSIAKTLLGEMPQRKTLGGA